MWERVNVSRQVEPPQHPAAFTASLAQLHQPTNSSNSPTQARKHSTGSPLGALFDIRQFEGCANCQDWEEYWLPVTVVVTGSAQQQRWRWRHVLSVSVDVFPGSVGSHLVVGWVCCAVKLTVQGAAHPPPSFLPAALLGGCPVYQSCSYRMTSHVPAAESSHNKQFSLEQDVEKSMVEFLWCLCLYVHLCWHWRYSANIYIYIKILAFWFNRNSSSVIKRVDILCFKWLTNCCSSTFVPGHQSWCNTAASCRGSEQDATTLHLFNSQSPLAVSPRHSDETLCKLNNRFSFS